MKTIYLVQCLWFDASGRARSECSRAFAGLDEAERNFMSSGWTAAMTDRKSAVLRLVKREMDSSGNHSTTLATRYAK